MNVYFVARCVGNIATSKLSSVFLFENSRTYAAKSHSLLIENVNLKMKDDIYILINLHASRYFCVDS